MYTILSLSDSDKHFDSAIAEYVKRMQKNLTIINLKPNKADIRELAIIKDTDIISDRLDKNQKKYDKIIMLSTQWKDIATENWLDILPLWWKYCFIIWWPHGLDEKRLLSQYQITTLWLGKQTMVHGLAKLVVIEQLYRIWMIQSWRSYHY